LLTQAEKGSLLQSFASAPEKKANTRRDFLRSSAVVGTGLVLTGCAGRNMTNTEGQKREETSSKPDENKLGGEVTATEDLMREHGVLRAS
jgi:hypothetical protein